MPNETTQPFDQTKRDPRDEHLVERVLGADAAEDMKALTKGQAAPDRKRVTLVLTENEQVAAREKEQEVSPEQRRQQYIEWAKSFDKDEEWVDDNFIFISDGTVETKDNLTIFRKNIEYFPPALKRIRGSLDMTQSKIEDFNSLNGVKIDKDLRLKYVDIEEIPPNLDIGGLVCVAHHQKDLIDDCHSKGYGLRISDD